MRRHTGRMASRVVTVRGPVEPSSLGRTSIHEHLQSFLDHVAFDPVDSEVGRELAEAPLTLQNRWFVLQRFTAMRDNLRLDDEAVAISEARRFVVAGGGCVVDPTTDGFGRDPAVLVRVSEAADLHVVMGAGYYIHPAHPDWLEAADEVAVAARIEADLLDGVGPERVRAGFIGEVGCSWPMTDRERKSLRAAGRAQRATGAALLVHPGRDPTAPTEIVSELDAVGADLGRVAIAHIERTLPTTAEAIALAGTGVHLSFDSFGVEASYYVLDPRIRLPNDWGRVGAIGALLDAGFETQVLVGQDICTKQGLTAYGGSGYAHLLETLPGLLEQAGRAEAADLLLVDNPARFLARDVPG